MQLKAHTIRICYHSISRDRTRHEVTFSLDQAGDKEPMLDFTLNQSESEQQFVEDVFRGFSNEEYDRDGKYCLSASSLGNI